MGLRPTHGDESRCHPEPSLAQGKLREGSAVPVRGELMQILRFAQNDSEGHGTTVSGKVSGGV